MWPIFQIPVTFFQKTVTKLPYRSFFALLDEASGQFSRTELDQHGILPHALNATPGNAVGIALAKGEKAALHGDDESSHVAAIGIQLQGLGGAEAGTVAKVDDLHAKEGFCGDRTHMGSFPCAKDVNTKYAPPARIMQAGQVFLIKRSDPRSDE